ncbi:MAG: rod shape-determining protein MreC [Oscillospiraceae bacterium]|nr:rod shape-determining protein MreC [Oscillospiraceae bacterium]
MKDFYSTGKFKALLALAVVLAGMMAWAGANNRLTAAPQELLGAAVAPFQKVSALLSEGVGGIVTKYTQIDAILAENEELKQENYELREKLVDYDRLKAENEAFRDLNNIREQNPQFEYASAFVSGRDPLDQFGGFTVDAGSTDGVEKGDVVVSDKGYLVGLVLDTGLTSSKVLTVLSPSLNAAGVVSRTRDNGILTGDSAYSPEGLTTFTNLPRDTLATVGDEIITTGLGEVFPANILVGTVQELVPEASGKSTVAVVRPGEDIMTLKHVQIIIER